MKEIEPIASTVAGFMKEAGIDFRELTGHPVEYFNQRNEERIAQLQALEKKIRDPALWEPGLLT